MELLAQYGDDDADVPAPIMAVRDTAPSVNTTGLALVPVLGGQSIVVPLASTKNLQGA